MKSWSVSDTTKCRVHALRATGLSYQKIASKVGLSTTGVYNIIRPEIRNVITMRYYWKNRDKLLIKMRNYGRKKIGVDN